MCRCDNLGCPSQDAISEYPLKQVPPWPGAHQLGECSRPQPWTSSLGLLVTSTIHPMGQSYLGSGSQTQILMLARQALYRQNVPPHTIPEALLTYFPGYGPCLLECRCPVSFLVATIKYNLGEERFILVDSSRLQSIISWESQKSKQPVKFTVQNRERPSNPSPKSSSHRT